VCVLLELRKRIKQLLEVEICHLINLYREKESRERILALNEAVLTAFQFHIVTQLVYSSLAASLSR
jgi:hypothetical protein